jgi:hypothetical protein
MRQRLLRAALGLLAAGAACVADPVRAPGGGAAGSTIDVMTGGSAGDTSASGAAGTASATGAGGDTSASGAAGQSGSGSGGDTGAGGGAGDTSAGAAGASGGAGSAGATAGASGAIGTGASGATGTGAAGQGAGGQAGTGGPPPNPCDRTSWTFTPSVICTTACAGMADSQKLPANAIDGNTATRWTTGVAQGSKGPESVVLSFPSTVRLTGINLYAKAATDFPVGYLVEFSTDGATFQGFTPALAGAGVTQLAIPFPQATALSAVRVTQTGKGLHWWSINELTVTGCAASP